MCNQEWAQGSLNIKFNMLEQIPIPPKSSVQNQQIAIYIKILVEKILQLKDKLVKTPMCLRKRNR